MGWEQENVSNESRHVDGYAGWLKLLVIQCTFTLIKGRVGAGLGSTSADLCVGFSYLTTFMSAHASCVPDTCFLACGQGLGDDCYIFIGET